MARRHLVAAGARRLAACALAACVALGARAHGDWPPQHGGVMNDGETSFELVVRGTQVRLYVSDHGTPLPTKGAQGTLTVTRAGRTWESAIKPVTANELATKLAVPLRPGDRVVARVVMGNGSVAVGRYLIER